MKRASNSYSRERTRNESKVVEEYCWEITQATVWSGCSRSGSGVFYFGFKLDFVVYSLHVPFTTFALNSGMYLLRKSGSVCNTIKSYIPDKIGLNDAYI
jgi:hypothetical protein